MLLQAISGLSGGSSGWTAMAASGCGLPGLKRVILTTRSAPEIGTHIYSVLNLSACHFLDSIVSPIAGKVLTNRSWSASRIRTFYGTVESPTVESLPGICWDEAGRPGARRGLRNRHSDLRRSGARVEGSRHRCF